MKLHRKKEIILEDFAIYNQELEEQKLIIMYFNIRSLNKNYEELCAILNSLRFKPFILICKETWILHGIGSYNIEGYDLYYSEGEFTSADGVVVYISNHLKGQIKHVNRINIGLIKVNETELKVLEFELLITAIY